MMKLPASFRIGDHDSGKNRRILQEVHFVPNERRKRALLLELLRAAARPAIVFLNAKKACDVVARDIESGLGRGARCAVLHSGKQQEEREQALRDFKSGDCDILVATDVAGRGLDIAGVEVVVNYDMPSEIARYVHRIGRTGRAGKGGRAVTLLAAEDSAVFADLQAHLLATGQAVPPELAARVQAAERGRG